MGCGVGGELEEGAWSGGKEADSPRRCQMPGLKDVPAVGSHLWAQKLGQHGAGGTWVQLGVRGLWALLPEVLASAQAWHTSGARRTSDGWMDGWMNE